MHKSRRLDIENRMWSKEIRYSMHRIYHTRSGNESGKKLEKKTLNNMRGKTETSNNICYCKIYRKHS